jgi:hypothetical protein
MASSCPCSSPSCGLGCQPPPLCMRTNTTGPWVNCSDRARGSPLARSRVKSEATCGTCGGTIVGMGAATSAGGVEVGAGVALGVCATGSAAAGAGGCVAGGNGVTAPVARAPAMTNDDSENANAPRTTTPAPMKTQTGGRLFCSIRCSHESSPSSLRLPRIH